MLKMSVIYIIKVGTFIVGWSPEQSYLPYIYFLLNRVRKFGIIGILYRTSFCLLHLGKEIH